VSLIELTPRPVLQRSNGACRVTLARAPDGARVAELYQSDPCRFFLPPREADDVPCGLLLTTSGGIAGGDRLALSLSWQAWTRASVTTGAAEKIYRAGASRAAHIATELTVANGAYAEWLPQETILFREAALERRCCIDLSGKARLLATDMVVLGRAAAGERFTGGRLHDRWEIRRDGKLVFFDALLLDQDNPEALHHPAGLAGAGAFGLALLAAPEAAGLADLARATLPDSLCGVTVVNDIMVIRWLAEDGAQLRRRVGEMIAALRGAFGLPARRPRIWQ
jgi:urease accessory protein